MRSQYLFSLALVAFATTSLAAPITTTLVEREPFPEDIKAAKVAPGKDFEELSERDADDYSTLAVAEASHSQTHNSKKRDANDPATLLAAAKASHGNQVRDTSDETGRATLLAAAEANHRGESS
jgi:hypothetical protein